MHKISVDDIELQNSLDYQYNGEIEELDKCNINANLLFKSMGDFISVTGHVDGDIELECDRCLNKFNYNLNFDIEETFAKKSLSDEYGQEFELSSGQFVTDLNGEDEIDVYDLLYQYVILNLPNKKVCGINCNEGLFVSDEEFENHDTRMDVFKNIRINKK